MTHCEIILGILSDYEWHNILDIMKQGIPGAINWSARSRISDLKKQGYKIESRIGINGQGEYRLVYQIEQLDLVI